jgi:hypothetical protein
MSLSRLRQFAMPYIFDYLDPSGENRKEAVEIDINTPASKGISKVYTKNKAVSFFGCNTEFVNTYGLGIKAENCFGSDFRYVRYYDLDHDSYHKNQEDYIIDHGHVLKGAISHKEMNERDFICLIDNIKKTEIEAKLCKDGKTDCLLADKDADILKNAYSKYLRQQRRAPKVKAEAEKIYAEVEKRFINGAQCFTQAFVTTFLDKYVQGLLINQGFHHAYARITIEGLKSTLTFALGACYLQTAMDAIIRNVVSKLLSKAGVNVESKYMQRILSEIGTVLAFTNNPFILLELGVNTSAAALGQGAAYALIHALPKLKDEEASLNQPWENQRTKQANDLIIETENSSSQENNSGLRLRLK